MDGVRTDHRDEKYELVAKKVIEIERFIKKEHNLTMAMYLHNECAAIYPTHPLLEEMRMEIDCRLNVMDCLRKAFDRALERGALVPASRIMEEMKDIDRCGDIVTEAEIDYLQTAQNLSETSFE